MAPYNLFQISRFRIMMILTGDTTNKNMVNSSLLYNYKQPTMQIYSHALKTLTLKTYISEHVSRLKCASYEKAHQQYIKAPLTQDHEVYTTVHEVGVFHSYRLWGGLCKLRDKTGTIPETTCSLRDKPCSLCVHADIF